MSLKGLIIGFLILTLILINTNTHSKLWHTPKPTGLIDLDNRNVHIHVHALPVDSYYHGPHTMEAINNWHERSFHQSGQNSWHNLLSRITFWMWIRNDDCQIFSFITNTMKSGRTIIRDMCSYASTKFLQLCRIAQPKMFIIAWLQSLRVTCANYESNQIICR